MLPTVGFKISNSQNKYERYFLAGESITKVAMKEHNVPGASAEVKPDLRGSFYDFSNFSRASISKRRPNSDISHVIIDDGILS